MITDIKKNKSIKIVSLFLMILAAIIIMSGCTKASTVQYNIQREADRFENYRKVSVINLRTDTIILTVEGLISIKDSTDKELAIIIKTGENEFKMHYVYVGSEIVYLVEQQESTNTNPYHWEVNVYVPLPVLKI